MKTNKIQNYRLLILLITAYFIGTSSLDANSLLRTDLKNSIDSANLDTNYYMMVDENACFMKGGINEFNDYISKNLIYPENEKTNKIEGKVIIQFGVNCFGDIGFVNISRSSGNINFDNEAIRVIKSSPKWKPAQFEDKFVGQNFISVVNFKL